MALSLKGGIMKDLGKLVKALLLILGISLKWAIGLILGTFKVGFKSGKFTTVALYEGWRRR